MSFHRIQKATHSILKIVRNIIDMLVKLLIFIIRNLQATTFSIAHNLAGIIIINHKIDNKIIIILC